MWFFIVYIKTLYEINIYFYTHINGELMYELTELDYRNRDNVKNNGEVFTPFAIVDKMLDMIPDIIWRDASYTFLEPTCGNGQFLVKIAQKRLLNGISVDDTVRTLIGFDISDTNINDCIKRLKSLINDDSYDSILAKNIRIVTDSLTEISNCKTGLLSELISNYDKLIVIGNPPYSISDHDDGNSSYPIYNKYVENIIDCLNPEYFTFITPSRWMVGGKGLEEYRLRMMSDTRIKELHHFGGLRSVFSSVVIPGGVSYFLYNRDYKGKCLIHSNDTVMSRYLNEYDDVILIDNNAVDILNNVQCVMLDSIESKCYAISVFGLCTNFDKFSDSGLKCLLHGDTYGTKEFKYVDPMYVKDKPKIVSKWKVCTAAVNGGARNESNKGTKRMFGDILILHPNEVATYTYLVVAAFDSELEAINFVSYMKTKFFRFMLGLRVISPTLNKKRFKWVPDMKNYTKEWTDIELYDMYNLTETHRNYIDSKIESMD